MSTPVSSSTLKCPCHGVVSSHRRESDAHVYCPVCVSSYLRKSLMQHDRVLKKRDEAKRVCAQQLRSMQRDHSISELEFESQRLRERLASLRHECGSVAVQVTSRVVENDERRAQQEDTELPREQLNRLNEALCDTESGALMQALASSTTQVKILRLRWALTVFRMHRLDVDDPLLEDDRQATRTGHRIARGIGKIGGLPLPHAGPELYGVLPPHELQSGLRLVASLISTVARCLGIVLPHPILLQPNGPNDDIVDASREHTASQQSDQGTVTTERKKQSMASSTTSLSSLMDATSAFGRSAKEALKRAAGQQALKSAAHAVIPPSMEASRVSQRLKHAMAAVLAEDHSSSSSHYELSHNHMNDDSFAIGLQLLQNNAVALCIRAGVPVANLWPAGAILLNLHALFAFCQEQVDSHGV